MQLDITTLLQSGSYNSSRCKQLYLKKAVRWLIVIIRAAHCKYKQTTFTGTSPTIILLLTSVGCGYY